MGDSLFVFWPAIWAFAAVLRLTHDWFAALCVGLAVSGMMSPLVWGPLR